MRSVLAGLAATAFVGFSAPAAAEIRALVVAVSQYRAPISTLEGPPNDAAALTAVLQGEGARDVVTLRDAQATRAKIRKELEGLGKRARPGDWVIFFYAGHGAQARSADASETDGMDEFMVLGGFSAAKPDPNQFVLDDDLRGWLINFFPTSVNVLQIADACHSGTMNRAVGASVFKRRQALPNALAIALPPGPPDPMAKAPAGASPPNLVYVGAAQDDQFALEGPLPQGVTRPRGAC